MARITWPKTYHGNLGRNGVSESCGVQVRQLGGDLWLEPINSRGDVTRCRIVISRARAVAVAWALIVEALRPERRWRRRHVG